ncbi:MAG: hypothetical protein RLN87_08190, partial [Parasphingopyxis sp.]|uniref:hypothetical protein n=1 Tax=Parasphingopyxis sp. TaxID=1920299 RepID=UPI0032ECAD96
RPCRIAERPVALFWGWVSSEPLRLCRADGYLTSEIAAPRGRNDQSIFPFSLAKANRFSRTAKCGTKRDQFK